MKKNYLYILFFLLISIAFIPNTYALDVDFDIRSSNCSNSSQFNFYCEIKDNTSFIEKYIPNKSTFGRYIADMTSHEDIGADKYSVFITKSSPYVEPLNTEYVVFLYTSYNMPDNIVLGDFNNNKYNTINFKKGNVGHKFYVLYFDSNFDIIDNDLIDISWSPTSGEYLTFTTTDLGINNDTTFYTSFLYSDFKIQTSKDIRVKYVITDTEKVFLNDNYGFFANFFNLQVKYLDTNSNLFGLEYLGNHYLASNSIGLKPLNVILTGVNVDSKVPIYFLPINFSNTDRKWLSPMSTSCSKLDSTIFYNSNTPNDSFNINYYRIVDDTIDTTTILTQESLIKNAFVNYSHHISTFKNSDNLPYAYNNYISLIYSDTDFGAKTFYYNPSCYAVLEDGETHTIFNPNTTNNISFTDSEQSVIFQESGVRKNTSNDFTIFDNITINDATKNISIFTNAVVGVGTLFTSFFVSMPPFIQAIGGFSLTLGIILILLKVILNR